jgi:hypothetical protein
MAQADEFNNAANTSISVILDTLKSQSIALDTAVRRLSGDQVEGAPMAMGAEEPAAAMGTTPAEEPADTFQSTDAAAGGTEPLGRERR